MFYLGHYTASCRNFSSQGLWDEHKRNNFSFSIVINFLLFQRRTIHSNMLLDENFFSSVDEDVEIFCIFLYAGGFSETLINLAAGFCNSVSLGAT